MISTVVSFILNQSIKLVYFLLQSIDSLPYAVLRTNISIAGLLLITSAMFALFVFKENKKVIYLKSFLLFILFLTFSAFYNEFEQRNSKQFIVYNYPKNPMVHFISGMQNYLISEEKLNKSDLYFEPFLPVVKKMGLNDPVLLTFDDNYSDGLFSIKNQLMAFEGKIVSLGQNLCTEQGSGLIDFQVNPSIDRLNKSIENRVPIIFTGRSNLKTDTITQPNIYFTQKSGAFICRW